MNWGGNMKNNYDIIFILNGKELVRYDFENSYKGEAQATCEFLAYENNVNINDIKVYYQKRNKFDVKLMRKFSIYGEFEQLDYNNAFSIISDCINSNNTATVKVNNKFYNIQNNEHFRYFVEEFGAVEL